MLLESMLRVTDDMVMVKDAFNSHQRDNMLEIVGIYTTLRSEEGVQLGILWVPLVLYPPTTYVTRLKST